MASAMGRPASNPSGTWRRSLLGDPSRSSMASAAPILPPPPSQASASALPSFEGTRLLYARTDYSQPSSRSTHSPVEVDSLRHMMSAWDGAANGSFTVSLCGIDPEQVSRVKSRYRETGDLASVFNSFPPGSFSIQLSREQIATAANAYEKAVASNRAAPSLNANPATWSLANAIRDPMLAAYHSIGSAATVPRAVFEQYISRDGPTDHARSEFQRLSEPAPR